MYILYSIERQGKLQDNVYFKSLNQLGIANSELKKNLGAEEMQYVLNEIGEKVFIVILEGFQECAGQKV